MTNKISMNKRYRTRNGQQVRILCIDNDHPNFPVVGTVGGIPEMWTSDGKYTLEESSESSESSYDLVDATSWESIPIDAKVLVGFANSRGTTYKRHFAGVIDGNPTTWDSGGTSFTTNERFVWETCVLYVEPENEAI